MAVWFYSDQMLLADSVQEQETHQDLHVCVYVCVCLLGVGGAVQIAPTMCRSH